MDKIVYLEIPSHNVGASKRFYGSLFGWTFQDWGPDYAAFSDAGVEGGFNAGEGADRPKNVLAVLETADVEAMAEKVVRAGGVITLPIFAFPGGRRFHFTDPSGQELALMQRA